MQSGAAFAGIPDSYKGYMFVAKNDRFKYPDNQDDQIISHKASMHRTLKEKGATAEYWKMVVEPQNQAYDRHNALRNTLRSVKHASNGGTEYTHNTTGQDAFVAFVQSRRPS